MQKPIRTCVICRKKDLKENLSRFSFSEGKISKDPEKQVGRGFYVHSVHELSENILKEIWQRRKK